jgi:hypothetical protein
MVGRLRPHHEVSEEEGMSVGEAPIKAAIKWIDEQIRDRPDADRLALVDEAGRRFDLSPIDADFLIRHLADRRSAPERGGA